MWLACPFGMQGEMINDSGTMTGGGGKPRGGRLRLGSGAPKPVDQRAAAAELGTAEKQEHASAEVPLPYHTCHCPCTVGRTQSAEPKMCESACVASAESKHFILQNRHFTSADCLSFHSASFRVMQALAEARERAQGASAAAAAAEKKLAGLQVAIPKARMEAEAQRHKAQDLRARLSQLKAATKVSPL